jgi:hypothetical protein
MLALVLLKQGLVPFGSAVAAVAMLHDANQAKLPT